MILCGIWVQLWFDNNISRRYPLPIVLMAAPLAALGLFALTDWLQRVSQGLGWQAQSQHVLAVAATVLVLAAGLIPGVASTDEPRRMAADVGRWVRQDFSTPTLLLGPPFMSAIVRYYSQNSSYMTLPAEANDASVLAMVAQTRADVVILWPSKRFNPSDVAALIERMKGAGLELLRPGILPDAVDDSYVLVRANRIDLARKPTPAG